MKKDKITNVVLVDEKDNVLGYKEKLAAHKNPVPLHRAISVVIFDKTGKKMLLQRRTKEKFTWPLYWTNTTCTNVPKGETYDQAAHRRLKEEMGFDTGLKDRFNFIYKAKYDSTFGEHELDHVFVGSYSGPIQADPKEADDFKWITIEELKKDIKENPGLYTPWFKIILKRLL